MVRPSGFEPITWEQYHFQDMHRTLWTQCVLMGTEEVIESLEQNTDETSIAKADGMKNLLEGLKVEASQGACVEAPWYIIVARNPL